MTIVAFTLAACSSSPLPAPTSTKTITVSATAAPAPTTPVAPTDGVHSELINVTLPPGTVPACCGKSEGREIWLVTTPYDYTVQSLRQQLPMIFHDYEGVPWCNQQINGKIGFTEWNWMDDKNIIQVHINQTGEVTITRKPDDEGRYGCDSP